MFLTCFSADSKSFIIFALEYLFPRPGLSLFTSFSLFSFSAARDRCADFFFRLSRFLSVSACWKGKKSVVRTMKSGSKNEVMKNSIKYFKFSYSFAVFMLWHVHCLLFLKPQFLLLLTCRRFLEGPRGWRPTLPLERPPPWPGWGHFSRSLLRPDPEILKKKSCYHFGRKRPDLPSMGLIDLQETKQ